MAVKIGDAILTIRGDIRELKKNMNSAQSSVDKSMKKMGAAASAAFALFTTGVIASGIKRTVDEFAAFEGSIAELGKVGVKNFDEIKDAISAMPAEFGKSADLAKAYYQIISAGVRDQTEAKQVLIDTAKATKAARDASLSHAQTIKVTTGLLNVYGKELGGASDALDLLFQIENMGRTSFGELVPVIGEVASMAKAAGASVEDMAGGLATITQVAGSTSKAATQMAAVFNTFLQPQKDFKALIESTGAASGKAMLAQYGLSESLKILGKKAQESGKEITDLVTRKEAVVGVSALMKDNFESLDASMDAMGKRTGSLEDAWKKYQGTFEATADAFDNTMSKLMIQFGEKIMPLVQDSMESFMNFLAENESGVAGFFDLIATGISGVQTAVKGIGNIAGTFGALTTGAIGFGDIMNAISGSGGGLDKLLSSFDKGTTGVVKNLNQWKNEIDDLEDRIEMVKGWRSTAVEGDRMENADMHTQSIKKLTAALSHAQTETGKMEQQLAKMEETSKGTGNALGGVAKGTLAMNMALFEANLLDIKAAAEKAARANKEFAKEYKKAFTSGKDSALNDLKEIYEGHKKKGVEGIQLEQWYNKKRSDIFDKYRKEELAKEKALFQEKWKAAEAYVKNLKGLGKMVYGAESYDVDYGKPQTSKSLQAQADQVTKEQNKEMAKDLARAVKEGQDMGATDSFMSAKEVEKRSIEAYSQIQDTMYEDMEKQAAETKTAYKNAAKSFFDVFEEELGVFGQAVGNELSNLVGNFAQDWSMSSQTGGDFSIGEFASANKESIASMAFSISKLFRDQDATQTKTQMQLDKVAEFAANLGWVGSLVAAGWNVGRGMTEHSSGGVYMNGQLVDVGDISTGDYSADPAVAYAGQQIMGDKWRSGGQKLSAAIETGDKEKQLQYAPKALGEWTDPGGALISGYMEEELGAFGGLMGSLITGNVFQGLGSVASAIGGEDAMPEINLGSLGEMYGKTDSSYTGSPTDLFSEEGGLGLLGTDFEGSAAKAWNEANRGHLVGFHRSAEAAMTEGFNTVREQFNNKTYMLLKDLPQGYADELEDFFKTSDFGVESILKNEHDSLDDIPSRIKATVKAYGSKLSGVLEEGTVKVVGAYIRNAEGLGDYYRPEAAEALASKTFQTFDKEGKATGEKDAFESVSEAYDIYTGLVQGFEDINETLETGEDITTSYTATMRDLGTIHENQIKWLEQMGFSEKALTETREKQVAVIAEQEKMFKEARDGILSAAYSFSRPLGVVESTVLQVNNEFENMADALRDLGGSQEELMYLEEARLDAVRDKILSITQSITDRFESVREQQKKEDFLSAGGTESAFAMSQLKSEMTGAKGAEDLAEASKALLDWYNISKKEGADLLAESQKALNEWMAAQSDPTQLDALWAKGIKEAPELFDNDTFQAQLRNTFESFAGSIEKSLIEVADRVTFDADWGKINDNFDAFFAGGVGSTAQSASGSYAITAPGQASFTEAGSGQSYAFSQAGGAAGLASQSSAYASELEETFGRISLDELNSLSDKYSYDMSKDNAFGSMKDYFESHDPSAVSEWLKNDFSGVNYNEWSEDVQNALRYWGVPGYMMGGMSTPSSSQMRGPTGGYMIEAHGNEYHMPAGQMSQGNASQTALLGGILSVLKEGKEITVTMPGMAGAVMHVSDRTGSNAAARNISDGRTQSIQGN